MQLDALGPLLISKSEHAIKAAAYRLHEHVSPDTEKKRHYYKTYVNMNYILAA